MSEQPFNENATVDIGIAYDTDNYEWDYTSADLYECDCDDCDES